MSRLLAAIGAFLLDAAVLSGCDPNPRYSTTSDVTSTVTPTPVTTTQTTEATPTSTTGTTTTTVAPPPTTTVAAPPPVTTHAVAAPPDGTYSFSQHRQGTCSGHGGVAEWL